VDLDTFLAAADELLAIPSTEDRPDELTRALRFTIDLVGPAVTVERFSRNDKPSALLYVGPVRSDFRIILNAHLDVVPAEPDQFRPYRESGRLYARGAHDMKISALVEAVVFAELVHELPYPIALQLVTDEEVGGRDGTGYQLEQGVTGRFVVIGEQTGLQLVTDSKGLIKAYLTATGRTGHSAYPWLGDNAMVKLIRSIEAILARYPSPTAEAWCTTVNVARIETTNTAFNQIPGHAVAWLDIRFPPGNAELGGREAREIADYLAGFCAPGVAVEVEHVDQPHRADRDRAEVERLDKAARDQGYPGGFLRKHGAADGRYYAQRGVDAVAFGIDGGGQHGPREYVEIASIEPYHRALTQFLRDPGPLPQPRPRAGRQTAG
jgi:succinyl-diaminopimelate desuccinylase